VPSRQDLPDPFSALAVRNAPPVPILLRVQGSHLPKRDTRTPLFVTLASEVHSDSAITEPGYFRASRVIASIISSRGQSPVR